MMAANQAGGERGLYCRFCGKKNDADSLFCIRCGKPMAVTPAPQKVQVQPKESTEMPAAPIAPANDFSAAQAAQVQTQPKEPAEMPAAPITPADDFSTAQAAQVQAQPKEPAEMPAAPIAPADDFSTAQAAQVQAQPEQMQPNPPHREAPTQRESAPHEPAAEKKEVRSFESIGQNVGKKVDELTRSGNVKVKQFTDTMDDDKAIEFSYLAYLISAVVAVIAPFMPYIKASAFGLTLSFNFVRVPPEIAEFADTAQWGDGIFLIFIAVAALVAWKLKNRVAMLVTGGGAAVFSIIAISQAQKARDLVADTIADNFVKMGIGYYLCALASFALLAFGFVYYYKTKEANRKETH